MRRIGIILAAASLTGCVAVAPTGFDGIAATGDAVTVSVPLWMNGAVRVAVGDPAAPASAAGRVRRVAIGTKEARGLFGDGYAEVERRGRFHFDLAGAAVGGQLTGDCVYNRRERRLTVGGEEASVTDSEATRPLRLRCSYARGGAGIGSLALDATLPGGTSERVGEVRLGDATLGIRSSHAVGPAVTWVDLPAGYEFVRAGATLGAVDLNGVRKRRIVLPRDPATRDAALAAGLTLALFWDPGDTDD